MDTRDPIKALLVVAALAGAGAAVGATVAAVAPASRPAAVKAQAAHPRPAHHTDLPGRRQVSPVDGGQWRPAARAGDGEIDITAHVNPYAAGGVLVCFALVAYWGRWQTRHRCASCGQCPAWCRCGELTHRHSH